MSDKNLQVVKKVQKLHVSNKSMTSNFLEVVNMYVHFKILDEKAVEENQPHLLPDDMAVFRVRAIKEEVNELVKAYANDDLEGIADALVDIVVFVLGTAALHNLPWESMFKEVMEANMRKEAGPSVKPRGSGINQVDLLKPEGWEGPNIIQCLIDAGWEGTASINGKKIEKAEEIYE